MKTVEAKRLLRWDIQCWPSLPELRDEKNIRLAKRHDVLSLRKLRKQCKQKN